MFNALRAPAGAVAVGLSLLIGAAPIGGISTAALAQATDEEQQEAAQFIRDLSDRAFAALDNENVEPDDRRAHFEDLLRDGVALEYVGKIVLGRFRREATPAQMDEYEAIFPKYIVGIYTSRILEIGDEELVVRNTVPQGKQDVFVRTELVRPGGGPSVAADWRVRRQDDGELKIIDLRVEGISMAETKRDEFASLISSRGFDGFLDRLRADAGLEPKPS